jgi:hypothetical protein
MVESDPQVRMRQTRASKAWLIRPDSPVLEAYELGEQPVPVPDLDAIAFALRSTVKDFQDQHGPVGAWLAQQNALKGFEGLSPEMQAFISKPINRPYLELAQRLSDLSVEKLRSVAEVLLEITL